MSARRRIESGIIAILSIVLALGLVFGCNKKSEDDSDKLAKLSEQYRAAQDANMKAAELMGKDVLSILGVQQILAANGIEPRKVHLFDQFYLPVSKDFVFATISPAVFDDAKAGPIYKGEQYDCDDEALAALVAGRKAFYKATGEKRRVAPLFGEFHYVRIDGSGGHAINCFIYKDGDTHKLGFFEPQRWKMVELTEAEIKSCLFCRF